MPPSINQLSLPFRKSTQLSLSTAIRQYISKKYDQHPDMFRHDLEVIDALRRDAVNIREAHPSGIKKLQVYAAQLVWISGKFPIDVRPPSPSGSACLATDFVTDRRRLHLVPCPGLQYRAPAGPEQP